MWWSTRTCLLALLVVLLGSAPWLQHAHAQLPSQLAVRWRGPVECPRGDFDRELTRLLGARAREIEESEVEVLVSPLAGGRQQLRLQLEVQGEASERVVELASCADARHTAALLVATALELRDVAAVVPPETPPEPLARPWSLRAGLLGDTGSLPGVSAGPNLGVAYQTHPLRLWLDARYLAPREQADRNSNLVGKLDLFALAVGGAWLWKVGPVRLGPLLEAELGALRGRGRGEAAYGARSAPWGSLLPGALCEYPVHSRVVLGLAAQLSVPLWRPAFALGREPAFITTDHASVRLGLFVRFHVGFKNAGRLGQ